MNSLSAVQQKFVLHWGEMGQRWGINRTVAQIHALLFIAPRPLNAEEIASLLGVARSNVSTSIKELQNWGIIKIVHVLGDRRDFFEATRDVWEMFRVVLDERKKREIDPTIALLRECVAESEKTRDTYTQARLSEMKDFFEVTSNWYSQISQLPTVAIQKFMKMGDRVRKLLGIGAGE